MERRHEVLNFVLPPPGERTKVVTSYEVCEGLKALLFVNISFPRRCGNISRAGQHTCHDTQGPLHQVFNNVLQH